MDDKLDEFNQEHELTPVGEAAPPETQEGHIPPSHEASFMNMKTLVIAGVGLFVLVLILNGLAGVLFSIWATGNLSAEEMVARTPPGPNLQTAPQEDLQTFLATQRAPLESYGWVNRESGVVRIPIQQAMELLVQRGLPVEPRLETTSDTTDEDNSGFSPAATPIPGSGGTP